MTMYVCVCVWEGGLMTVCRGEVSNDLMTL